MMITHSELWDFEKNHIGGPRPRPDQFLHELHKFRLCMRDEPLDACALAWPNGKMLRCQKDGEIIWKVWNILEIIGI